MSDPFDLYDHPAWYDILFRKGSSAQARGLLRVARAWLPTRRRRLTFVEPACGTGRLLVPLARFGQCVLGYDRNPAMVAYAAARLAAAGSGPTARIVAADLTGASGVLGTEVADVAFTLDNSMRLLPDTAALAAHLEDTARLLVPGGLYILGLTFHDPDRAGPTEDVWEGRRGSCRVRQVVQFLPPAPPSRARHEEVIEHLAVETPRGARHFDARWRLLLVRRTNFERLVRESAFDWVGTVDSSGESISPGTFESQWLLLRRRSSSSRATKRPAPSGTASTPSEARSRRASRASRRSHRP